MSQSRCPLCHASAEPAELGPKQLNLQRCLDCTVVFLPADNMPRHVEACQEQFFSEMDRGVWQCLLERLNANLVLRRIKIRKGAGRLLEVGLGNGNFLRAAKRAGYDCTGVEASAPMACAFAENNTEIAVFGGYLEEFVNRQGKERFDVIVMNHVLEHIPDPGKALRQLRGLLAEGGILHIAVPNVDAWEARLQGWTSYEAYHLYYFGPKTLADLARQAGFAIDAIRTSERFSGWTNALIRTVLQNSYQELRLSGNHSRASLKQHAARAVLEMARVITGTITLPIRILQSQLGRGEELIAILEHR